MAKLPPPLTALKFGMAVGIKSYNVELCRNGGGTVAVAETAFFRQISFVVSRQIRQFGII